MNTKTIKIIVFSISILFILVSFIGVILNKYDDKLLKTQIDVTNNLSINKDLTLKLNIAFRSIYVNYDNLLAVNKILKSDISNLVAKRPNNINIKKLENIILKQDNEIDLIQRANSLITNSLQFIKYYHMSNPMIFTNLSQDILDMSYEIKLADYSNINKYAQKIEYFESINIDDKDTKQYRKVFLMHAKMIFNNAELLKKSLSTYYHHQNNLNTLYHEIKNNISIEHLLVKDQIKLIQIILVILLFVFVFLISRFLRLEKQHKEEANKLQNIIDKNVIMSTLDLNGICKSVSSAYCDISGFKENELVQKPNYMLNYSAESKEIKKTLDSGEIWRGEFSDTKKDGTKYWVSSVIEPVFDENNKIKAYLGIRHDITNTISLEELTKNQESIIASQITIANEERDKAIQASKTKSEFLANMSHEIRTPLNAISGFIGLLEENEKDKRKQEYLHIINDSNKNLLSIINDILDFSKVESGKFLIDKISFNPNTEFELLVKSFQSKFKEKGIDFLATFEKLPSYLNGDLLRIQQVINNLLSNAYKFTDKNHKVYLKMRYKNSCLDVVVEDEGIGISNEYQKRIFDSFSQEDSSTTRKYGGTGLGLSISSNLINLMGGELTVNSQIGKGSIFQFTLPLEINNSVKEIALKDKEVFFKGHLLLAEDNKANQMFMKVVLGKIGLTLDIAKDGVETVEMFKNNNYDLILMDENMPNMSGIEATKIILDLEKNSGLVHTPIIGLTANALVGDRERFLASGMDEYLTKPLNRNNLKSVLSMFLTIKKSK